MPDNIPDEPHLTAQAAAAFVAQEQAQRAATLQTQTGDLHRLADLWSKDYADATTELQKVVEFVKNPQGILGNPGTKHGEVAEQVEVAVRNARDYMAHLKPSAAIDVVHRTGPVDYVIDGVDVQSKFINGTRNTLDHILDHAHKYEAFDGVYHIPRDQYAEALSVRAGESTELGTRAQQALLRKISEVEASTGRPFEEVVRPGVSSYRDVQLGPRAVLGPNAPEGPVHDTMRRHQEEVDRSRRAQQQDLRDRDAANRAAAEPSLAGAAQAAAMGAAAGAGVQLATGIYAKLRQGKNPLRGDFTRQDWADLGVGATKGAVSGGVSAAGIYTLTNCTDLAAPFAGAVVSSALALNKVRARYHAGEIDFDEFVDLGQLVCAEGAIVGLTTAIGQTVIPLPILGALVGAAAGRLMVSVYSSYLGEDEKRLTAALEKRFDHAVQRLDASLLVRLESLIAEYERLGVLTTAAFDPTLNAQLRLSVSVRLAQAHGVAEAEIIKNEDDLDVFMRS
ncbi:MAG: hypothetical protein H6718_06735 [Polyangiaceae bacterium]|nr:hypothetical protein [Polyangiaceae bacterium]